MKLLRTGKLGRVDWRGTRRGSDDENDGLNLKEPETSIWRKGNTLKREGKLRSYGARLGEAICHGRE
jgi:hypothetical protein